MLCGESRKCGWLLPCLQFQILDILYKKFAEECGKRKADTNVRFLRLCTRLTTSLVAAAKYLTQSKTLLEARNAPVVQKILMSKDIARLLKLAFERVPEQLCNDVLIASDAYFSMLCEVAKDKIITIRAEAQESEDEGEEEDEGGEAAVRTKRVELKEKRLNYLSEFANFLDQEMIRMFIANLREGKLDYVTPAMGQAIENLLRRISDDLRAHWILFRVDILNILDNFYSNNSVTIKTSPYLLDIKKQLPKIFDSFKHYFKINSLLVVECMFRVTNY